MQNYMKMRDQYAYLARQSTWGGGLTRRPGGSQGGVAATSPGRIRLADGEEYSTRRPLVEQLHKKGIQDVLTVIYGRISRVSNERQCFLRCALQAHQEGKMDGLEKGRGISSPELAALKCEVVKRLVEGPLGCMPVEAYCRMHGLPEDEDTRKRLLQNNQDKRAVESMQTVDHMYFATALTLGQPIMVFQEQGQEDLVEVFGAITDEALHQSIGEEPNSQSQTSHKLTIWESLLSEKAIWMLRGRAGGYSHIRRIKRRIHWDHWNASVSVQGPPRSPELRAITQTTEGCQTGVTMREFGAMVRKADSVINSSASRASGYVGVNYDSRTDRWIAKHSCKEGKGKSAGTYASEWEAGTNVTKAALNCPHCFGLLADILLEDVGDSRGVAKDVRRKEQLRREGRMIDHAKGTVGQSQLATTASREVATVCDKRGKVGQEIDVIYMDKATTRRGIIRRVECIPSTRYWTQLYDDGTHVWTRHLPSHGGVSPWWACYRAGGIITKRIKRAVPLLDEPVRSINDGSTRQGTCSSETQPDPASQSTSKTPRQDEKEGTTKYMRAPVEEEGKNGIRIGANFQAEVPCGCTRCLLPLETRYDSLELFPHGRQKIPTPQEGQSGDGEKGTGTNGETPEMRSGETEASRQLQARKELKGEASKHAYAFTNMLRRFRPTEVRISSCTTGIVVGTSKGRTLQEEQVSEQWVRRRMLSLIRLNKGDYNAILKSFHWWRTFIPDPYSTELQFSPTHIAQNELHEYLERCWDRARHGTTDMGYPISKGEMTAMAIELLGKRRYQTSAALRDFEEWWANSNRHVRSHAQFCCWRRCGLLRRPPNGTGLDTNFESDFTRGVQAREVTGTTRKARRKRALAASRESVDEHWRLYKRRRKWVAQEEGRPGTATKKATPSGAVSTRIAAVNTNTSGSSTEMGDRQIQQIGWWAINGTPVPVLAQLTQSYQTIARQLAATMGHAVEIYWPDQDSADDRRGHNLNIAEILAGDLSQWKESRPQEQKVQGTDGESTGTTSAVTHQEEHQASSSTERSARALPQEAGNREWQVLDALPDCIALWLGEEEKPRMRGFMENELTWTGEAIANGIHEQAADWLLDLQGTARREMLGAILKPHDEGYRRQRPSKWSILRKHMSPRGDFGDEEDWNEHATQYDDEVLQMLWGTKEAEVRYTHIFAAARHQEAFTVVPIFATAWGRSWHQTDSREQYRIRTLLLMIHWKKRKGVLIDIQGGMRASTGQSLTQLPISPQCAVKRPSDEGEVWQCLQAPGQGPYKVKTTRGPVTATLTSDGCIHNMPVLMMWDGQQAHTDLSTKDFEHWEEGDRIWVAWGEALIEATILAVIPFPARWEVEYWPDKEELERARGTVRFLPGMSAESGWVPCDVEGRVMTDTRILYNDSDESTSESRETRIVPGDIVHVNAKEDGCAGQVDQLGKVVFRMDNVKHKCSQSEVTIAAVRTGDKIYVQQDEQTLEGQVTTVRRKWPHYQIRLFLKEGEEKQAFAHFQPQLGSKSGWQICGDTRVHMSTWEIDAKSTVYRTAKWLPPTTWRGLEARALRIQRELRGGLGSLRAGSRETEEGWGGWTSAKPVTREEQVRLIREGWEKYKIYATTPPGEWMHNTTYEGASTEGRMESSHPTFRQ